MKKLLLLTIVSFPILKDLGQKVADMCGATRTPQVYVLDRDRKICYAGRSDAPDVSTHADHTTEEGSDAPHGTSPG